MSLSRALKTFLQPRGVLSLHAGRSQLTYRIAPQFSSNNETPEGFDKFKRRPKKQQTEQSSSSTSTQEKKESKAFEKADSQKEDDLVNEQTIIPEDKKDSNPFKQVDDSNADAAEKDTTDEKVTEDKEKKESNDAWSFKYSAKLFGFEEKKKPADKENSKKNSDDKKKNEEDNANKEDEEEETQQSSSNSHKKKKQEDDSDPDSTKKRIEEFLNKGNNKRNVIAGIALAILTPVLYFQYEAKQYISYTEFLRSYLQPDNVKSVVIQRLPIGTNVKTYAKVTTKDGSTKKIVLGNVDHFLEQVESYQLERGRDADSLIPITFEYLIDVNKALDYSFSWLSTIATISIGYLFFKSMKSSMGGMKGGGGGGQDIFGMGKSNVKVFGIDSKVTTRFKDVAGQDEAKQEIMEFVDFLKKPTKYKAIGAKLPRGALLTGPPGTGKTLLAKACAGEAGVPFYFISGSDFVEMFVGVGASRVRDLFKQAKAKSPSIIFIDEIDAVGRKRENKMGGNDERDNTLNQLLVEMDGFGTDSNVIVLAATNRKELLDPALTRPGRFDRSIDVTNPDIDGRKQIFMVHLKPLKLHPSKTIDDYARRLATLTPGFSGADIMNLCNEAAILAARKNKKNIESIDFELASERVIAGLEKKRIVSEEERRIVAVHESGHAVASWFLAGGHPLLKLTIIPRTKGSLGFAQYLPNESSLESKEELLDRLCTILGGRVAEEEFFGSITTGAYDDLKRAYELSHALVTKYGMSEKLGYVGYIENDYSKTYSDATNTLIDEEIKRLIDEATIKTRELIKSHRNYIEGLSNALLEKETLDLRQITSILGHRPFPAKSNFKAYLDLQDEVNAEKDAEAAAAAAAAAETVSSTSTTEEATTANQNNNETKA